jgi:hypothetical protein
MTEIERLEQAIKAAREALPYADGRAYYDTLDEIATMELKLKELKDANGTVRRFKNARQPSQRSCSPVRE